MPDHLPDMAVLLGLVFPSVAPEGVVPVRTWTFTLPDWSYADALARVRQQAEAMEDREYAAHWLQLRSRQLYEYELYQRGTPTDEQTARLLSAQYAELQALSKTD